MKKPNMLALGLMTSIMLTGLSGGAQADTSSPPKSDGTPTKMADKDLGRLSVDGVSAFSDIHLARMALFDGKTEEAAKLISDAQVSLGKAKTDDAIFVKATSALRGPSQPKADTQDSLAKNTTPIAWVPIDSEMVLGETYQPTPEKAAAVVSARKALVKGDSKKSVEMLKLAQVDVDISLAVAPLEQSIADIDSANGLISKQDYYGAGQALRKAEIGVRYDEIDDVANVKNQTTAANTKSK